MRESDRAAQLLESPRYEVLPFGDVEEAVLEHVPLDVTVTVTTSPKKGLEPTLDLVERIAASGYAVVPHLAARHVRDRVQLAEIVARLRAAGANDVLVMAGDAEAPAGDFDGALPLLQALVELGRPFAEVGITGYPESHAFLADDAATRAMVAKAEFATYVVTQICFEPKATAAWMAAAWAQGTRLPIYVGVPGPVPRAKLLRVCERIGVGNSMRTLDPDDGRADEDADHFDPEPLVSGLAESLVGEEVGMGGIHIFTFNDLEGTERWRQDTLARVRNR